MGWLSFIPFWVIVVAVLLLIVIVILRSSNNINVLYFIKENFFYFFLFIVFALFAISIINIHRTHDLDVSTFEGMKEAVQLYFAWLGNFFSNIAKVTGYAVQQDWIAPSSNNSTTK